MSNGQVLARWRQWLLQIEHTHDRELSCSECFDQISGYVDLELTDKPATDRLQPLRQHLEQCQVCREEYEVLRDLALLEIDGHLASDVDLPDALTDRDE